MTNSTSNLHNTGHLDINTVQSSNNTDQTVMGSDTSTEDSSDFIPTTTKKDMRYGGNIHLWSSVNVHFARKDIPLRSHEELNEMVAAINRRSQLIHPNFSTVKNYKSIDQGDFCNNSYTLKVTFEYFDNDLGKEIARRAPLGNYMREQRVLEIIYQVCDCLAYLEQNDTFHGDIKPANVFFDSEDTPILLDSYFTNLGRANFELVLSSPTCQSYLSPAQLEKLKKGNYQLKDDKYKNQIFSLGMTILETMLLRNSFDCYEFNLLKVIDTKLMTKFAEIRQKYSHDLARLVEGMLELDQQERPSAEDILRHPLMRPFNSKTRESWAKGGNAATTGPISPPSNNISRASSKRQ